MSESLQQGTFGVDPGGLRKQFREIFSDSRVFVREVLQNSLQAVRMLGPERSAGKIEVRIDPKERTVEFVDNGVAMSYERAKSAVSRFFSTEWKEWSDGRHENPHLRLLVEAKEAFSRDAASAEPSEEGLSRDVGTDDVTPEDIGRFGLGLTTCLMVADAYEVVTYPRSGGPASEHRVEVGVEEEMPTVRYFHRVLPDDARMAHGTRVRVHIGVRIWDGSERVHVDEACLDETAMQRRIERYMRLVEVPIFLNGRLVAGGNPTPGIIPEIFYEKDRSQEQGTIAYVDIVRGGSSGYVRARLGLSWVEVEEGHLEVYSRGVLVGVLASSEVLGDHFSVVSGVLDSNMYDLQIDRNRLQKNAQLRTFQRRMGLWFCEALAEWGQRNWVAFTQVFAPHRARLLKYLCSEEGMEALRGELGGCVPFATAGKPEAQRPLSYYIEHPYQLPHGERVIPFSSAFSERHPALGVFSDLGVAAPVFDLYVPTVNGKVNLDYFFVMRHSGMTGRKMPPIRIDVLLREACADPTDRQAGYIDRVVNVLRSRFEDVCDVAFARLGTLPMPGLVATSYAQMLKEEAPGFENRIGSEGQLGNVIHVLATMAGEVDLPKMYAQLHRVPQRRTRPTVILNLSHAMLADCGTEALSLRRRVDGLAVVVATLVLSSTKAWDTTLGERIYEAVARLMQED